MWIIPGLMHVKYIRAGNIPLKNIIYDAHMCYKNIIRVHISALKIYYACICTTKKYIGPIIVHKSWIPGCYRALEIIIGPLQM